MQRAAGDPLEACFWSAAAVLQARAGRAGEVNRMLEFDIFMTMRCLQGK